MQFSLCADTDFMNIINYELIQGNPIWRFILLLVLVLLTLAAGKTLQHTLDKFGKSIPENKNLVLLRLFIGCLAKPANIFVLVLGLYFCQFCIVFDDPATSEVVEGVSFGLKHAWSKIINGLFAISIAYALFHLVDIVEYYLQKVTVRTETMLDDMLVPAIRKSLRITIGLISFLFLAENIFGAGQIKSFLVSAGIGGIAIALAAKDTIANFFGSITIFIDRPFHIKELVKMDGYVGTVEEVGFRSTKLRTLDGHMVTVPNSVVANAYIENIGQRQAIRRVSNITITYDCGPEKAAQAVEIIKEILAAIPQVNTNPDNPPRVYFDEFNDWSLNIYMSYWVFPADWWLFKDINQNVNIEMMKRFHAAGIEYAFPSQTLYVKKDN